MSTRNRRAAEVAAEVINSRSNQGALRRLQFDEPLSWRAGKPIAISELLRRLSALSKELREMEQEENDRDSFTHVAKELTGHGLLAHKDKGVRAWTACCLVDILRLCAPDAPYTGAQLRDIFTLIITSVLPALSDPSNAYNSQHTYVLQSLAQVKSVVLLTDIPGSETLILQLFTSFFDILSGSSKASTGEQIGKNVEYHMTAVLVILVDEAAHLPLTIVDTILAQFLRADPRVLTGGVPKGKRTGITSNVDDKQSTLLLKELPPAYNMAKTICNSCPEKMARYVSQYFNDVIVDASASVANGAAKSHSHRRMNNTRDDSDDEETHNGPTEEDLKELQKAHRLLRELWRASPAVLQNVIPQLEAELSAENVQLRLLATEALGDMISGIGAAGPPPPPTMDPTIYPPPTLDGPRDPHPNASLLTTPSSPQPFPQVHPAAYHSFLSRKHDKSAVIRASWATAIGRILSTSAGGIGLNPNDERTLLRDFALTLVDADERVRVSAVTAVGLFSFAEVVLKLGSIGGVEKEGSVMCNLAGRARDRKHAVRVEGMMVLGRIWGVAAGEIAAGNTVVISVLGAIPSKLFDTFYVNDLDINALLDHVLFELLLPLDYPPSKSKNKTNGTTQPQSSQSQNSGKETTDWDRIRTERMLHLVKSLDTKAKKAFFAVQGRQVQLSSLMQVFLKRCEEYNGGVMEENEAETRGHLNRLIAYFAQMLPDSSKVTVDLWKFVKAHDRRNYQLVRFCMDPSSDYRTVVKAIKELRKRILAQSGSSASILDSLMPLLYRASLLVYNKSHIPAILDLSRSDDDTLGPTAQEVLKEISTRHPEVFKTHVNELCRLLQDHSPTEDKSNEAGALDALKACAAFARHYPKEMPRERKFLQCITNYALYGTPPVAAKYAVSIILATSERKEMHARDLVQQCTRGFDFGARHFLPRLAALSQLVLLAPNEAEEESDAVLDIALRDVLLKVRNPNTADKQPEWIKDEELDEECKAKIWALRILVNRVRSHPDPKTLSEAAQPVYQLLNTLILQQGESSKTKDTPATHRSRFRLAASLLLLKLSTSKTHDDLLLPRDFDRLACTAQDSLIQVRSTFMRKLKKYLGQGRLSAKFYSIVFLQAFEPQLDLREDTTTWIRSRAKYLASKKSTIMEALFARLLSLLAHHPDFDIDDDDTNTTIKDLEDFAQYILFYLRAVATEENLSLIYYVAQRVKQAKDAVTPERSENLYVLSDLAQAVIRRYEDVQGWSMQAWPGKMGLPGNLFKALPDHEVAQEIATKSFLPEGLGERLDILVKAKPKMKKI
ncbi:MAG: Curved DNA-binding protein (42 kDa protein) [Watsoniomyces obsoletus]|nr:MAG: Curved DNA-binding protein (42 kDa protein) [Watsoniomyces obsoletus]